MTVPFKAVIFDLDGTLADTAPDLHAALNRGLEREGKPALTNEQSMSLIGGGADKMLRGAYDILGEPLSDEDLDRIFDEFLEDYRANCVVDTKFFPGAPAAVAQLRDWAVVTGICTNKRSSLTGPVLEGLGANGMFEPVVCYDEVGARKPDPAPLNRALELAGVSAEAAIMVGDSAADMGAARNAGVKSIAVSFGYTDIPPDRLGADALIDHFDELIPTLRKF